MRATDYRLRVNASGNPLRVNRHEPLSSIPLGVQRALMQKAQPSEDLLALQKIIAGCASGTPTDEPLELNNSRIHESARLGTSGSSGPLPYLDTIQRAFGRHDVSGIAAYMDGTAAAGARAMKAEAFTTGNRVAFAGEPRLHTVAHEAAHVIQQRAGVQLASGVGAAGDRYERHADAVADLVVQGRSAEAVLAEMAPSSPAGGAVQQKCATCKADEEEREVQQKHAAEADTRCNVQAMAMCPKRLRDPDPTPPGWIPYNGDTSVFHCGYRVILEDRVPTRTDPINECVYDHAGTRVDENHPDAGCRGTPDQYYSKTDPIKHGAIDSGGIVRAGMPAYVDSRKHDALEKLSPYLSCLLRCATTPSPGLCMAACAPGKK